MQNDPQSISAKSIVLFLELVKASSDGWKLNEGKEFHVHQKNDRVSWLEGKDKTEALFKFGQNWTAAASAKHFSRRTLRKKEIKGNHDCARKAKVGIKHYFWESKFRLTRILSLESGLLVPCCRPIRFHWRVRDHMHEVWHSG